IRLFQTYQDRAGYWRIGIHIGDQRGRYDGDIITQSHIVAAQQVTRVDRFDLQDDFLSVSQDRGPPGNNPGQKSGLHQGEDNGGYNKPVLLHHSPRLSSASPALMRLSTLMIK